jgi:hypothetical protein
MRDGHQGWNGDSAGMELYEELICPYSPFTKAINPLLSFPFTSRQSHELPGPGFEKFNFFMATMNDNTNAEFIQYFASQGE